MAIPKNKNFSDYDNYLTDSNPTTAAQAQDYFKNQAELVKAIVDSGYWQPETSYTAGAIVLSPSMPAGAEAICVTAGKSSTSEPSWGAIGGANVSDGTCFWKVVSRQIGTPISIANGGTGATTVAGARKALGLGNTSGAVPIANGGTGATTAAGARNALGLGNTSGAVPVANGGTGATTGAAALVSLGICNTAGHLVLPNGAEIWVE
jgi:hypothetical protein